MACIEIYEALLAENDSPTSADAFAASYFQPEHNTQARRSGTTRYHVLIDLAHALDERYSYTGQESDLVAAIAQGQTALVTCGTEFTLCPTVLVIYAGILHSNFERTNDRDQLHMAESMCRQALALCTTACTLSATAYHTLGSIMYRLHERVGTSAYLDEALDLQKQALKLRSVSHSIEDPKYLVALASYTLRRHERLGDPQDIDNAMSLLEQALEMSTVMHINRVMIVLTIIHAVGRKHSFSGRPEDLNKAIDLGRQTMAAPNFPRGDRRLAFMTALANLLLVRYQVNIVLSADGDLEESVNLRRVVFQSIAPGSMVRSICAHNLAIALQYRFTRKGELQDLEESIELSRYAIDVLPDGHNHRADFCSSLGTAICRRFYETRDAADLDEALVLGRFAMAAMSPLSVHYWSGVIEIISYLCIRFEIFQAADDINQAVSLSEGLLKTIPDGHTEKDHVAHHLAKTLLLRGAHMNAREDIDRAICELVPVRKRLVQTVVAPEVFRTLAASYLTRFRLTRASHDAGHALDITNDLLDVVEPSHYERFQCLVHAAELYSERGTPFYNITIALKHIAEAMLNSSRDIRSRMQGAKTFLDIVKTQYKDIWATASPAISARLLDVYISAISFLPRVAFFGLHLHSRLQSLAIGQSIALDGASHALNISLPERALEVLEQGRAIFWNHTLQLRSPFDHVPDEFRDQLASLARQLEKSSDALGDTKDSRAVEKELSRRRQQSEEFNSLVDRVRCFPGMERFLLHDEYATLAKAADRGPVVVLVSSALSCHAIVVKSADEIISIPLDAMTEPWLDDSGNVWRTEVTRARSAVRDSRKMVKIGKSSKSVRTKAEDILERLWTCVVFPILNKLDLNVCCFSHHEIWLRS
jgi:hypothetical protein